MKLPPELLTLVVSFVPHKKDLKHLRFICKSLSQAIVPFVFDEVSISEDSETLAISKLLVMRFGPCIKTLFFSCYNYEKMEKDDYESAVKPRNLLMEESYEYAADFPDYYEGLLQGYNTYCRMCEEQSEIVRTGEDIAHLHFALSRLINLRRVVIVDSIPEIRLESLLGLRRPPLVRTDWLYLNRVYFLRTSSNSFLTLLIALSITNSAVKEIKTRVWDSERSPMLSISGFALSPRQVNHAKSALSTLTKLCMKIDVTRLPSDEPCYSPSTEGRILSAARHLRHLDMQLNHQCFGPEDVVVTSFQILLEGCKFSKLDSLILARMDSTEAELLSFLERLPSLQHLNIEDHTLSSGLWENVAPGIRDCQQLKSVQLEHLYGGFGRDMTMTWDWTDSFGELADFVFHNDKNPFTPQAFEKYRADMDAHREIVWKTTADGVNPPYTRERYSYQVSG